jgi:lipopolysaccharide transport system ATP-binding protein
MSDIAVSVRGIGKRYRIAHEREPYGRLTETLSNAIRHPRRRRAPSEEFWALRDVSFEVPRGEVVGVIGRNGAGKSTLLKILSRITEPSEGEALLRGRAGSLLEVGTGFHPELTGRENVYLSGSILGMRRAEIERRFDAIVAFAEVERFLDTPVKRYSSGMQVRLGFAVAAHLDPEILLVDEVLAVGDAQFRRKSLARLGDVARAGRTAIFVSHDLGSVASLTSSCVYLESGRIKRIGPTADVVGAYQHDALERSGPTMTDLAYFRRSDVSNSPARMAFISWRGTGPDSMQVPLGSAIEIDLGIEVLRPVHGAAITVVLKSNLGEPIAIIYSQDAGFALTADPGVVEVLLTVRDLPLAPGRYSVDAGITQGPGSIAYDVVQDYPVAEVVSAGKVVHWQERPWGPLHPMAVTWAHEP